MNRHFIQCQTTYRDSVDGPICLAYSTHESSSLNDDDAAIDEAIRITERELGAGRYAGYVIHSEVRAKWSQDFPESIR